MAAFPAPCAVPSATDATVTQTARPSHGTDEEAVKCRGDCQGGESGHTRQNTMLENTHEFFQICDIENKGFITRRDLQRLSSELPLSAEELENVFDTLDSDKNGFLTFEEFSSGFSKFLYGQKSPIEGRPGEKNPCKNSPEVFYQTEWEERLATTEDEEEKHFCMLMDRLGANSVFEDPVEVHNLWAQLRRDEPHLLSNFEDFLARVTSQIILANQEKREMESALKRKAATHDDEIQRLYEEMEQQIKTEKDRIVLQDYEQFLSRSQDMELQLTNKERELDQLFQKQRKLEKQCQDLHSEQHVTKVENVKLKQTNDELARDLENTSQELILAQEQLTVLQEQSRRLHEEKEMEIYRLTEGLQRERASLLKQLDLLREMNKHLRDEKDMCYMKPKTLKKTPVFQQRHLIGKNVNMHRSEDEEEDLTTGSAKHNLANGSCQPSYPEAARGHLQRIISIEEDHLPHLLQNDCLLQTPLRVCREGQEAPDCEETIDLVMSDIYPCASQQQQQHMTEEEKNAAPTSPRGQPVGKETSINVSK